MHIDIPTGHAAAFMAARDKAIRAAIKGGVRPICRPADLKFDESRSELLPMMETYLPAGVSVGQKVSINKGKFCPWGLEIDRADLDSTGIGTQLNVTVGYVLCFVDVRFEGKKCGLTTKYAIMAYGLHCEPFFTTDIRVPTLSNTFSNRTMPHGKVILLPVECLEPVKN